MQNFEWWLTKLNSVPFRHRKSPNVFEHVNRKIGWKAWFPASSWLLKIKKKLWTQKFRMIWRRINFQRILIAALDIILSTRSRSSFVWLFIPMSSKIFTFWNCCSFIFVEIFLWENGQKKNQPLTLKTYSASRQKSKLKFNIEQKTKTVEKLNISEFI